MIKYTEYIKEGLNKSDFNIGDRVVSLYHIYTRGNNKVNKDQTGTIIDIQSDPGTQICVEWDNVGGHNGNTPGKIKGKDGHCWWVYSRDIDIIEKDKPIKIRWYKKGKLNESSDIKINVEGKNYLVYRLIDNLTLVVKKRKAKSLRIKGINGYVNKETFTRRGKFYETHFELTLTNKDVIVGDYNSKINNICVKVNNEIIYDIDNKTFDNEVLLDKIVGEYMKYLKNNKYKINEVSSYFIKEGYRVFNCTNIIGYLERNMKDPKEKIEKILGDVIINKVVTAGTIFTDDDGEQSTYEDTFKVRSVNYDDGYLIFVDDVYGEYLIDTNEDIIIHDYNQLKKNDKPKEQIRWYKKGKLE